MRVIVLVGAVVVAALAGISFSPRYWRSVSLPHWSASTLSYDFGRAPCGSVIRHSFEIRNDSDRAMEIANVTTSCGCTVVSPPAYIAPRSMTTLPVVLQLPERDREMQVSVTVSSSSLPPLVFTIRGKAVEECSRSVVLPPVRRMETSVTEASLRSFGASPVAIRRIIFDQSMLEVQAHADANDARDYKLSITLLPLTTTGDVSTSVVVDTDGHTFTIAVKGYVEKALEPLANPRHAVMKTRTVLTNEHTRDSVAYNRDRSLEIALPARLDFEENYEATASHFKTLRNASVDRRRIKELWFDRIEFISPAAALVLASEVDRWNQRVKGKLRAKVDTWNPPA